MLRRFWKLLMSRERFAQVEAESRDWFWTCGSCGHEFSVWDIGGVRYKAAGNPSRLVKCPVCSTAAILKLRRRSERDV